MPKPTAAFVDHLGQAWRYLQETPVAKRRLRRSAFALCFGAASLAVLVPAVVSVEPTATKLVASDAEAADGFGFDVALDADTLLVGAPLTDSGRVYFYRLNELTLTWQEIANVVATDAQTAAEFGGSVAIAGDTAWVGADLDNEKALAAGAAYAFRFDGTNWSQEEKLTASDGQAADSFGFAVAVTGDTALVGAVQDDDELAGLTNSGSAWVFRYNAITTSWDEEQKLTASDAQSGDEFGGAVALSGDTAVVGAELHETETGAAYIFRYNAMTMSWDEEQKLTASDAAFGDGFGFAVAVDGDTAVVGAYRDDAPASGLDSGAAYIFLFDGTEWIEQTKLTASDAEQFDRFGYAVAIRGDTIVVGANQDAAAATALNSGAAYIFLFDGTEWIEQTKLAPADLQDDDRFGVSVALSADTAAVGAYQADAPDVDSGAVYVFTPVPEPAPQLLAASALAALAFLSRRSRRLRFLGSREEAL